jgi:hypothetical protein
VRDEPLVLLAAGAREGDPENDWVRGPR